MKRCLVAIIFYLFIPLLPLKAAKLAIVIDDFGYRPVNEAKILNLSSAISIAILPDAPHASRSAELAHQNGHDILIHLPMLPLYKQPLEKQTLTPDHSESQITEIIASASRRVPYAKGVNNHMGSLMTADLPAMLRVMNVLAQYDFFFLDSKTNAKSQGIKAANAVGIPSVSRDVFLDNINNEKEIRVQFDRAVNIARRQGAAVVIGHPYTATVKVLTQALAELGDDIELVPITALIRTPFNPKFLDPCTVEEGVKPEKRVSSEEIFREWEREVMVGQFNE